MPTSDGNRVQRIQVIDSHTAGEPTRVVVDGGPDLGDGSLVERRERFRDQFDHLRSAIVNEPRGSDVMVGALLCPPTDSHATAGVIFFNNVSYLNMCGHGAIGLVATLAYLKRIQPGEHAIETPVGVVRAELHENGAVTIENVPSYRYARQVAIDVDGYGRVVGDVAWGGNWFFLVEQHEEQLTSENIERLIDVTRRIRRALTEQSVTGENDAEIDHIELFGPPIAANADSRNFVLCPGGAYDRSPCGTGTSAKLACLAADGKLAPGETWLQESITDSTFSARYERDGERIVPSITGTAYVTAEATLILQDDDPLRTGIRT